MSAPVTTAPAPRYYAVHSTFRKFTLDEYYKLIELGIISEDEPVELLEGYLVVRRPFSPAHESAMDRAEGTFPSLALDGWFIRCKRSVTLSDSEPKPDYALIRGPRGRYRNGHPISADIGLLIEVADATLDLDRTGKGRIYARAGIPVYWVVNVVDKVIEVYTQPGGTGEDAAYAQRADYPAGTAAPVVLDGAAVGAITVAEVTG